MKILVVLSVIFFTTIINANTLEVPAPTFDDVVRDGTGKIQKMSFEDALRYCAKKGKHFVRARDLARLAMNYGAEGISDKKKSDYLPIWNEQGKVDFYYR